MQFSSTSKHFLDNWLKRDYLAWLSAPLTRQTLQSHVRMYRLVMQEVYIRNRTHGIYEGYYEREIPKLIYDERKGKRNNRKKERVEYYYINYSYTTLSDIGTIYLYMIYFSIILLNINKTINFVHMKRCQLLYYYFADIIYCFLSKCNLNLYHPQAKHG